MGAFKQTVLYSFGGYPVDGAGPSADLSLTGPVIFTEPLSMVGRAQTARELCLKPIGCGTVFELIPTAGGLGRSRCFIPLQGATSDGAIPAGNLIMDANGNLYGHNR